MGKGNWEIKERIKEIEKLKRGKGELEEDPRRCRTNIREEVKDLVNKEVKSWKEEKENYKMIFKEIFEQ